MMLLPIADRELRTAARKPSTYWGRVSAGGIALLVSIYAIWMTQQAGGGPMAGIFLLKFTSYVVLALCLYSGIGRTCDSLSSEKREDTLGLLFLTHLKGYDVVLGKLAAASLRSLFLLIGLLPILSIPVLFGGVSGYALLRLSLCLVNTLFLALSVGLFISSLVRAQRAALTGAGVTMVVLAAIFPVLGEVAIREWERPLLGEILRWPSPFCTLEAAFGAGLGLSANQFAISTGVQFALGLGALLAACRIAPHSWKIKEGRRPKWRDRLDAWLLGSRAWQADRRASLLEANPIYWLESRDRYGPLWPILFALVLISALSWLVLRYDIPKEPTLVIYMFCLAIIDLAVKLRVGTLASARFIHDRQIGALEMILSSPFPVSEIVRGQWMAIRRNLLGTHLPLLAGYLGLGLAGHSLGIAEDYFLLFASFLMLISVGDFITIGYVAMWLGMRVASGRQAPGLALARVVIAPWALWLGLLPIIQYFDPLGDWFDARAPYSYLTVGVVIWSISSLRALRRARNNLRLHFREAATDRYHLEQRFALGSQLKRLAAALLEAISLRRRRPSVLG